VTDAAFARAFEAGSVAPADFHHFEHLRVAWACLREADSVESATNRMRAAIVGFVTSIGKAEKYHETLTVFWMRILAGIHGRVGDRELAEIIGDHPDLSDAHLARRYYSAAVLDSEHARRAWIAPERGTLGPDVSVAGT
jgi:hypothetical protein